LHPAPNLILTDYYIPQFSAERALILLQARGMDVPFIIVSGLISEEVAVALMRAGAYGYLLKDDLTRLRPAVRRELREAHGRAQRRLAEQRLHAMFKNAQAEMYQLDLSGRILQSILPTMR
jgi:DNA-binding NtrC family response regulator